MGGPREQVCLTPQWLYALLDARFGPFDFDPAPDPVPEGYDGLDRAHAWGARNYLNPPFDNLDKWAARAAAECTARGNDTLMLCPCRPQHRWWHDTITGRWPLYPVVGYLRFRGYTQDLPQPVVCVWFTRREVPPEERLGRMGILRPVDVMRQDLAAAAAAAAVEDPPPPPAAAAARKPKVTHQNAEASYPGALLLDGAVVFRGPVVRCDPPSAEQLARQTKKRPLKAASPPSAADPPHTAG